MRTLNLNRSGLVAVRTIIIAICLIGPVHAQTVDAPPPSETPAPGDPRISFSDAVKGLADRATELLPTIQNEIEAKLLPWLEDLSLQLALVITLAAFAKLWRENSGAGADLFWWFGRLGIILALLGNGPQMVNWMSTEGKAIAAGEGGQGVLVQFCNKQQLDFDKGYTKFTEGIFTVGGVKVESIPGGVMGTIFSKESEGPDPNRILEGITKEMPILYDSLSFSRAVITFGDFFLSLLRKFLLIAMRLTAPIMIALAIDRSLAQRVTYPYLWGVIVLTLIWPIVVLVIKSIAYMGGNIAVSLGDGKEYNTFDENTMGIIQSGDPYYTALFAAVIMLISGLCLFAAPYIAYQLSVGRVYEAVSQAVSSWVSTVAGAGIGLYSAAVGASISRQAEVLQANAQQTGEGIRAEAAREGGKYFAAASRGLGYAQTNAQTGFQNKSFEYNRIFQGKMALAQSDFSKANLTSENARGYRDLTANLTEQRLLAHANALSGATTGMGALTGAFVQVAGAMVGQGRAVTPVGAAGGMIGPLAQMKAARDMEINQIATSELGFDMRVESNNKYLDGMKQNQGDLYIATIGNNQEYAKNLTDANNASAGEIKRGYDSAYGRTLAGNESIYKGTIDAAGVVRNAAVEAARKRYLATMVNAVGNSLQKGMDGLTLRY